jgi:hypothetical protein
MSPTGVLLVTFTFLEGDVLLSLLRASRELHWPCTSSVAASLWGNEVGHSHLSVKIIFSVLLPHPNSFGLHTLANVDRHFAALRWSR